MLTAAVETPACSGTGPRERAGRAFLAGTLPSRRVHHDAGPDGEQPARKHRHVSSLRRGLSGDVSGIAY